MRELLVSGPGTGKTSYCLELFKKEILKSKGGIDSRSFFVLPNREHAERIQNLILKKDIPGLFNAHILTINDLVGRFLGMPVLPRPSDALRQSILREILEGPGTFPYFESSRDLAGFHRLLSDLIKEFKSGLLSTAEFEKRAQPLLRSPVFRSKFRDFTVLLKNYEKKLATMGFAEPEDAIAELVGKKPASSGADLVVFDGFYHFSRAQCEWIRAISQTAAHTIVTLTISGGEGSRPDLFYYPDRTRTFLKKIGFKEKKGSFLVNHRIQDPALSHLESQLFSKDPVRYAGSSKGISIFEAHNLRGEIEMIAREIRRLSREESMVLSDICVILRSVSPYQKTLAAVFEKFNIPVYIHERAKLKESALGSFLWRFLNLCAAGWKRGDLMALAKSSFYATRVSLEDALRLERISFNDNVVEGREAWLGLADKTAVPPKAKGFCMELAAADKEILGAKSIREFTGAVRRFLGDSEADRSPIERSVEELLRNLEQYYLRSNKKKFEAAAVIVELQSLIESALFSVRPLGKNQVQVYDVVMAIPKEYKVVFVGGLLERTFPQRISEDALFKDEERRVINKKGDVLEERLHRIAGERYFFYMALMRSAERIILTYPLYDADDRPCLPSFFVEEVRKCFKEEIATKTRHLSEFLPGPEEWETEKEVTRGLADALGGVLYSSAEKKALRKAMREWFLRDDVKRVLEWADRSELDAVIRDARVAAAFSANRGPFSATRLEEMASCAFRYFASQVLGLKETPDGRESMEMGTALHAVLESYFKSLPEDVRKTGRYTENIGLMKDALKKILVPIAEKSPLSRGKPHRFQVQMNVMRKALDAFAEAEAALFTKRGLAPNAFELKFGYGEAKGPGLLEIKDGAESISVRGQIDRIDVSPDGKTALVADYKLSKRPSVHDKIEKGLELQLPIYLLAARKLLGYDVIGAEHRYLREPGRQGVYREDAKDQLGLGPRETVYTEEEFEGVLQATEQRVRDLVHRIRKADISVRSRSCTFCQFAGVCRFEPWRLVYSEGAP